ncbi:MAG: hypothetical protein V4459_10215 [Pseudomonadota bacterium]
MKKMISAAVLVAGAALATTVVAQTGMRVAQPSSPVQGATLAPASAADIAQLKARLTADEAKIAALEAKTTGMVGGLNQLTARFDNHKHKVVPVYGGTSTMFLPIVPCKSGAGFGGGTITCGPSSWPGEGGGYPSGIKLIGYPTDTGKPVN